MIRTFRLGGIHPAEHKLSAKEEIRVLPIPTSEVIIPLGQHIGTPAEPIVKKGDVVKVGTVIARSGGRVSSNIHSSVSGRIIKIDEVFDASGYKRPAIYIQPDGLDEWEEEIDRTNTIIRGCDLEALEIVTRIHSAGVVGLGGATFPTHIKLSLPSEQKPEVLILNGVECEPYLTSDHALMLEHGEEILIGAHILMRALNCHRCIVAIECNKPDAIEHMRQICVSYEGVEVMPLKVQYPQGGEKQLVEAVLGKQIKSGLLPISVGAVVQNVGTVFAVYEAIQKRKPLIERIVTITGLQVGKPGNFRVRVGTPIKYLIEASGGMPEDTGKIIGGGPMMGKALLSAEQPITKGCSGILLFPQAQSQRKTMRNCIRCAKCVNVCPMGLNPAFLMRDVQYKAWEDARRGYVVDCIECGSCSYVCPSSRPLLDYIRIGKQEVRIIMQVKAQ